jgi:hypothetical protein
VVEGVRTGITSKRLQYDKYEWGDEKKRVRKTDRTNEVIEGGRVTSDISTDTPQAQLPLGLSVGPEQATNYENVSDFVSKREK